MYKRMKEMRNNLDSYSDGLKEKIVHDVIKNNKDIVDDYLKKESLTEEECIAMVNDARLTARQLISILRLLRLKFGRDIVTPKVKQALSKRNKLFDDLFTSEYLEEKFEDKNGKINRWLAYCTDSNELLERIAMLRGKELKDLVQKAGFDDGKSFLKLTMTIYDPEDIIPCDGNFVKRASKPEHILAGQKYKDTGVNKIIILGIVEKTPESYINCKLILDKAQIHETSYIMTGDLKIYLIILHLTSSSSRHPCPFCLTYKDENGVWVDSPLRTLEGIIESYE